MKMTVTYAVSRDERKTVEGSFTPMDGPLAGFCSIHTGEHHVIFPYESITEIIADEVPECFVVDVDTFKRSKEIHTMRRAAEHELAMREPSMGGAFQ